MRITMGCGSTGRAVRLELEVTAPTPADAVREVRRQCDEFARVQGCEAELAASRHPQVKRMGTALAELQAKVAKLTDRRDRWRKRAEDAGLEAAAIRESWEKGRADLQAALRERDAARAEAERLRAELAKEQAQRVWVVAGGGGGGTTVPVGAGGGGAGGPLPVGPNRSAGGVGGGGGGASYHGGGIGQPPSVTLPVRRSTAQAPNPTPTAGSEVERLLSEINAAVQGLRTSADGIRADLIRSREARR